MENKWLAMINMKKTGTTIRSIMKISGQIIGPDEEQKQMKIDLSDMRDATIKMILPPELNTVVYQWKIGIFNGRNMKIDCDWFSKIDPMIRVTIGENTYDTKHCDDTNDPEFNFNIYLHSNQPSMIQHIKFELFD